MFRQYNMTNRGLNLPQIQCTSNNKENADGTHTNLRHKSCDLSCVINISSENQSEIRNTISSALRPTTLTNIRLNFPTSERNERRVNGNICTSTRSLEDNATWNNQVEESSSNSNQNCRSLGRPSKKFSISRLKESVL